MTTATTIPAELAAFAWQALAEGRTNVLEAVDWLREQANTDDVDAVKRALYWAAADGIDITTVDEKWRHTWNVSCPNAVVCVRGANFAQAESWASCVSAVASGYRDGTHKVVWLEWYDRVNATLKLCRAVEAA